MAIIDESTQYIVAHVDIARRIERDLRDIIFPREFKGVLEGVLEVVFPSFTPEVLKELDQAFGIHYMSERCWCGPTRHSLSRLGAFWLHRDHKKFNRS